MSAPDILYGEFCLGAGNVLELRLHAGGQSLDRLVASRIDRPQLVQMRHRQDFDAIVREASQSEFHARETIHVIPDPEQHLDEGRAKELRVSLGCLLKLKELLQGVGEKGPFCPLPHRQRRHNLSNSRHAARSVARRIRARKPSVCWRRDQQRILHQVSRLV